MSEQVGMVVHVEVLGDYALAELLGGGGEKSAGAVGVGR